MAGPCSLRRVMPRLRTILLVLLLFAPPAQAALLPALDTSSPQATYRSFVAELGRFGAMLQAYEEERTIARQVAIAHAIVRIGTQVFDLDAIPQAVRWKHAAAAIGYLADIVARLPEVEPPPQGGPPPPLRWTVPGTEIRLQRITEGPRAGEYVFSAATLARLPEFHAQIIDEPVLHGRPGTNWRQVQERIAGPMLAFLPVSALPQAAHLRVLGTPAWKLAIALAVDAAVLAAVFAWWRFVRRRSRGAVPWRRHAAMLSAPVLLAALLLAAHVFNLWQVNLGGIAADISSLVATFALHATAAWGAWIACWLVAEAVIASPAFPDSTYDANLMRLLARVGSLISAGLLLMLGANAVGVPALGLLAGVSIGGVALALAAQSTVENLFGGVSIFADKPFRVGDGIRYGANSGTVVSIGPRSSRIRGADGSLTTVPNSDLARTHITNLATRDRWAFQHRLGVPRDTPRARLIALLEELRRRVAAHPLVAKGAGWPRVRLVGVTDGTLQVEIGAQILTADEDAFLDAQQMLILDALEALEAARAA